MLELDPVQMLLVALLFVWAGFVRSGLGFGGAALGLPLMRVSLLGLWKLHQERADRVISR